MTIIIIIIIFIFIIIRLCIRSSMLRNSYFDEELLTPISVCFYYKSWIISFRFTKEVRIGTEEDSQTERWFRKRESWGWETGQGKEIL